jgi:hypothetical protein
VPFVFKKETTKNTKVHEEHEEDQGETRAEVAWRKTGGDP